MDRVHAGRSMIGGMRFCRHNSPYNALGCKSSHSIIRARCYRHRHRHQWQGPLPSYARPVNSRRRAPVRRPRRRHHPRIRPISVVPVVRISNSSNNSNNNKCQDRPSVLSVRVVKAPWIRVDVKVQRGYSSRLLTRAESTRLLTFTRSLDR